MAVREHKRCHILSVAAERRAGIDPHRGRARARLMGRPVDRAQDYRGIGVNVVAAMPRSMPAKIRLCTG